MNYKSQQFDVIFLFNVIENIPNQIEFFNEISRVLKPQGLFIFNFVDMERNIISKFQKDRYFLFRPPVCYLFSMPVLDRFLAQMKLKPIHKMKDIRYLNLEKIATLLGFRWVSKIAERVGIHKLPFLFYAYPSQIVVCKKII
jgi:ubiquinone/menaquinone biosynthesis C-methylase UbiE